MTRCTCYPAEKHGRHYNEFIAEGFGECLYTTREVASFYVGMSSLLFWIVCCAPQFVTNYKRKSAGALSKWFLLEWFLGDLLNLCGALLSKQLSTQISTGFLFVVNDVLMITQLIYYTIYGKARQNSSHCVGQVGEMQYEALQEGENEDGSEDDSEDQDGRVIGVTTSGALAAVALPIAFTFISNNKLGDPTLVSGSDFVAVEHIVGDLLPNCEDRDVSKSAEKLGMAIGWVSSIVYLNSRIPQILKNQKRRSVEGLSILMFAAAVMGNTTYGLGVLLRDPSWTAIERALPWLVGSLGTLALDFTILLQFWCFSDNEAASRNRTPTVESTVSSLDEAGDSAAHGVQDGSGATFAEQAALHASPDVRGLFGIKAWDTSPFFQPGRKPRGHTMAPLNLRDTASLGVLPSEQTSFVTHSRTASGGHGLYVPPHPLNQSLASPGTAESRNRERNNSIG